MSRISILVMSYSTALIFLFSVGGNAQEEESQGTVSGDASSVPITGDEAGVSEEVVIILKDGTAVHGKVLTHLPSGYLIEEEGVYKTVPFSNVAKVIRVGEVAPAQAAEEQPAAATAGPLPAPAPVAASRPELPPDFPRRPPRPGAGLVASGWPMFAVGWIGALTFFNLGIWWDWDRFWPGIPAFGALALVGLILAPIGHGKNRRARNRWAMERKQLLDAPAGSTVPLISLELVTPIVLEHGGGLGFAATF